MSGFNCFQLVEFDTKLAADTGPIKGSNIYAIAVTGFYNFSWWRQSTITH